MKRYLYLIGLSVALLFGGTACHKTLEVGGAYSQPANAPDLAFYGVDAAFWTAYSSVDAIFTWERDNRAFLWKQNQGIKHALDNIRPTASAIVKNYLAARETYKANPTPAGLDLLQTLLAKAQQLAVTAQMVATNLKAK